jgi:hypothetical protein
MAEKNGLIEWCKQQRGDILEQLDWLRSGKLTVQGPHRIGSPVIDTTSARIGWLERNLAELDAVLAQHPDA